MDVRTTLILQFQGNRQETYHDHTLLDLARREMVKEYPLQNMPLLIVYPNIGRKLYYSQPALQLYAAGDIAYNDFIGKFQCDGLYRNKTALKTDGNAVIDPEHLWLKRKDNLILLDEDRYVTCTFNKQLFYLVE